MEPSAVSRNTRSKSQRNYVFDVQFHPGKPCDSTIVRKILSPESKLIVDIISIRDGKNKGPSRKQVLEKTVEHQRRMKRNYDRQSARNLPELKPKTRVTVVDNKKKGLVLRKRTEPRSYDVQLENGTIIRRNRRSLRPQPNITYIAEIYESNSQPGPERCTPSKPNNNNTKPTSGSKKPIISYGLVTPPAYIHSKRESKPPERYQAEGPIRNRRKT